MKLADAAANYVAHKQSMGMRFRTEARTLKSFCHAVGDVTMQDVSVDEMAAFLAENGPITRFWERKYSVLRGFYRFAIARGYVDRSPLPRNVPRPLQAFEPYIYSREELRRLLDAVVANDHPRNHIDPETYRVLLLLLYGAGLRISEALALNHGRCRSCRRHPGHSREQILQDSAGADRRRFGPGVDPVCRYPSTGPQRFTVLPVAPR